MCLDEQGISHGGLWVGGMGEGWVNGPHCASLTQLTPESQFGLREVYNLPCRGGI